MSDSTLSSESSDASSPAASEEMGSGSVSDNEIPSVEPGLLAPTTSAESMVRTPTRISSSHLDPGNPLIDQANLHIQSSEDPLPWDEEDDDPAAYDEPPPKRVRLEKTPTPIPFITDASTDRKLLDKMLQWLRDPAKPEHKILLTLIYNGAGVEDLTACLIGGPHRKEEILEGLVSSEVREECKKAMEVAKKCVELVKQREDEIERTLEAARASHRAAMEIYTMFEARKQEIEGSLEWNVG